MPRKPKQPALKLPSHLADEFEVIAKLITPNPPTWLARHLQEWASTILLSNAVDQRQPTRVEMKKILESVSNAAALLQRAIGASSVCEFLDAGGGGPMDSPAKFQMVLGELKMRADSAVRLPNIINSRGKARAGKGRALTDGAISAQTYCALLVAETWKWFRGKYPAPRNMEAAKAINLYWQMAGGQKTSWGDIPLTSWRHHLTKARMLKAEKELTEYRRHLGEAQRSACFFASDPA